MASKDLLNDVYWDSIFSQLNETPVQRRKRLDAEVELEDRRAMRVDSNPQFSVWDGYHGDGDE